MYIVLEIQEEKDGTVRVLEPAYYEAKEDALQKYYVVLSYAVKSELMRHTAMILTTDGQVYKSECYMNLPEEVPVEDPAPVEDFPVAEETPNGTTESEVNNEDIIE